MVVKQLALRRVLSGASSYEARLGEMIVMMTCVRTDVLREVRLKSRPIAKLKW